MDNEPNPGEEEHPSQATRDEIEKEESGDPFDIISPVIPEPIVIETPAKQKP